MKISGKNVLVTGASGFIGSHLTERLVRLGSKVRAFVRYNSRDLLGLLKYLPKDIIKEIDIFQGDIRDPFAIKKAMSGQEVVFHLAALIAIPYSYRAPHSYIETNIIGTLNLMEASLEKNIEKLIHSSTSECYGTARYVPIDEGHPLQGQSPYSASKIGADMLAESYHRSFKLPVAIIRPFNTFGPRQSLRAIIPNIVIQGLSDNIIKLGNLFTTRDFNFVSDTVEGFIKVAECDKSIGETINVGSGVEISIVDLVNKIGKFLNRQLTINSEEIRRRPRESEVIRLVCNNRKAQQMINWESRVSIDQGLNITIDWMKENRELFNKDLYAI